MNDSEDCLGAYAVLVAKSLHAHVVSGIPLPNLFGLMIEKLGTWILLTAKKLWVLREIMGRTTNDTFRMKAKTLSIASGDAALCDTVGHIVLARPEEEVSVISARPIVAFVANEHAGRNRPNERHVGKPVRSNKLFSKIQATISGLLENRPSPDPAGIITTGHVEPRKQALPESLKFTFHMNKYITTGGANA